MNQHVKETKVWGTVQHIFHDEDRAAVSYLEVNAGFRCSTHTHAWRANQFSVISGRIIIEEWDSNNKIVSTMLYSGESHTVPSGVTHRFRVLESGVVIEVYWADTIGGAVLLDDITRFNEGGKDDS